MFEHLQIANPRERLVVGIADVALRAFTAPAHMLRRRSTVPPRRILLLRLERIGDLVMALEPIREIRRRAPDAEITLAVGSWNRDIARHIPAVDRVDSVDLPWLARGPGADAAALTRKAQQWRHCRFDLVVNFEGDIRTNALAAATGAPRRVGFAMGGGGSLLTHQVSFDPRRHTTENALRLVEAALSEGRHEGVESPSGDVGFHELLRVPSNARARAEEILVESAQASGLPPVGLRRALVGVHAAGGREVKQWPGHRFAEVATIISREQDGVVVLTGAASDRSLVDSVRRALPQDVPVLDVVGQADLVTFAALLERLRLLLTCDTGPMHLAAALGTPVVGVFGPSDPTRYGPRGQATRAVRIQLPCSPCNRVRLPPARCTGHVPDCLTGIAVEPVVAAARELLDCAPGTSSVRVLQLSPV